MGWQDRSYYRDSGRGEGSPLMWLLNGSVHIFTVFGIRVRLHASLIVWIALILLFGLGQGFTWQDRLVSSFMLFTIVLLHEFGHCFAARYVGGDADEVLLTPLGGLAMTMAPRRWKAQLITVVGGPAVNVLICAATGAVLWYFFGFIPWNPSIPRLNVDWHHFNFAAFNLWGRWVYWTFWTSWFLLIFNLLPIFPLDGGQILQALLWPKFGYYRSMNFACVTGMIGAGFLFAWGLVGGSLLLLLIAVFGFITCLNIRRQLQAEGPWAFQEEDGADFTASLYAKDLDTPKRKHLSKRVLRRAQKREAAEAAEQAHVDAILAKVSAHGMHSLTWFERRALKRATERQRKRDVELREEMTRKGF